MNNKNISIDEQAEFTHEMVESLRRSSAVRANPDGEQKLGFYFYGAGEDLHQADKQHRPVTDEQKKEFLEMIERWTNEG